MVPSKTRLTVTEKILISRGLLQNQMFCGSPILHSTSKEHNSGATEIVRSKRRKHNTSKPKNGAVNWEF
jgi:hypothetical protein